MTAALHSLLADLIDYAGLFPPAELDLPTVVDNYARYQRSAHRWMLGRLIIPAGQLGEFGEAYRAAGLERIVTAAWKLSVLVPAASEREAWQRALQQIADFQARRWDDPATAPCIDTLEGKANQLPDVDLAAAEADATCQLFLELPWGPSSHPLLDAIVANPRDSLAAKIRTGGVTPAAIPSPAIVADFLAACAARQVPFKATAGLHHPLRGLQRLTYRPEAPQAPLHGFLNVFVAALAARCERASPLALTEILEEARPAAFHLQERELGWQARRFGAAVIAAARREFALAFGSCSFREPVDELQALGVSLESIE